MAPGTLDLGYDISQFNQTFVDFIAHNSNRLAFKMDELPPPEMDIEYMIKKFERSQQEKAKLKKRIQQLEAEHHALKGIVLKKRARGISGADGDLSQKQCSDTKTPSKFARTCGFQNLENQSNNMKLEDCESQNENQEVGGVQYLGVVTVSNNQQIEKKEEDLGREFEFKGQVMGEEESQYYENREGEVDMKEKISEDISLAEGKPEMLNRFNLSTPTEIRLSCRSVRIGSLKVYPEQNSNFLTVWLTKDSIIFPACLCTDNKTFVEVTLKASEIKTTWIHFGQGLPLLFVLTSKKFGDSIRKNLNMSEADLVLFDPESDDLKKNKLTFLIDTLSGDQRHFMCHVFPGPEKVKEIDFREANKMLVLSTPTPLKENLEIRTRRKGKGLKAQWNIESHSSLEENLKTKSSFIESEIRKHNLFSMPGLNNLTKQICRTNFDSVLHTPIPTTTMNLKNSFQRQVPQKLSSKSSTELSNIDSTVSIGNYGRCLSAVTTSTVQNESIALPVSDYSESQTQNALVSESEEFNPSIKVLSKNDGASLALSTMELDKNEIGLDLCSPHTLTIDCWSSSPENSLDSVMESAAQPLVELLDSYASDDKIIAILSEEETEKNFDVEDQVDILPEDLFLKCMSNTIDSICNDPSFTHSKLSNTQSMQSCPGPSSENSKETFHGNKLCNKIDINSSSENSKETFNSNKLCNKRDINASSENSKETFNSNKLCNKRDINACLHKLPQTVSPPLLRFKRSRVLPQSQLKNDYKSKSNKSNNLNTLGKKKRRNAIHNVPKSTSAGVLLSKNASFLPLPKKDFNKKRDSVLKIDMNKSSASENSASPALEDAEVFILPDLDDSIFENMPWKTFVKPFQLRIRILPDSVPKSIAQTFKSLEKVEFTGSKLNEWSQTLTDELTSVSNAYKSSSIVFYVLKYLSFSDKNPVFDYKKTKDKSVLLPPSENCIVSALLQIDSYLKSQNKGFLLSVVITLHQLVLAMDAIPLLGLCSFCRVLTKICKSKKNANEPIALCCDILKMKHRFAPMLVASIVGVWSELFDISYDASGEETAFYSSISYGAQKWPHRIVSEKCKLALSKSEWQASKSIVEEFMSFSVLFNIEETVDFLMDKIKEKCIDESYSSEYMLTTPLVIFAAYKDTYWVKENIIDKHIVPSICTYVTERNERALTLFCQLYAEICVFYPKEIKPEDFLFNIFEAAGDIEEDKFMQDSAALPLIQLSLARDQSLPKIVMDWVEVNENNPKFANLKLILFRDRLKTKVDFTEEDIL